MQMFVQGLLQCLRIIKCIFIPESYDNDKEDSYGAKNYGRPRVDHGDKNGRNYVGNFNDDNDPSNYERRRTRKTYGNSG